MEFYLTLATLTAFCTRLASILIGTLGVSGFPFAAAFAIGMVALLYLIYIGKIGKSHHLGLAGLTLVLGVVLGLVVI